eukprot:TRINITY_DN982_c0_g1_i3.p1 TRINITY_DN982_c0_g1~~TRINITY_DN982_c0_g1_i3.p1  ORF type:complete len:441 (+),score=43.68 TRINITY_DN982_c0_g1_i3:839-2161(+)
MLQDFFDLSPPPALLRVSEHSQDFDLSFSATSSPSRNFPRSNSSSSLQVQSPSKFEGGATLRSSRDFSRVNSASSQDFELSPRFRSSENLSRSNSFSSLRASVSDFELSPSPAPLRAFGDSQDFDLSSSATLRNSQDPSYSDSSLRSLRTSMSQGQDFESSPLAPYACAPQEQEFDLSPSSASLRVFGHSQDLSHSQKSHDLSRRNSSSSLRASSQGQDFELSPSPASLQAFGRSQDCDSSPRGVALGNPYNLSRSNSSSSLRASLSQDFELSPSLASLRAFGPSRDFDLSHNASLRNSHDLSRSNSSLSRQASMSQRQDFELSPSPASLRAFGPPQDGDFSPRAAFNLAQDFSCNSPLPLSRSNSAASLRLGQDFDSSPDVTPYGSPVKRVVSKNQFSSLRESQLLRRSSGMQANALDIAFSPPGPLPNFLPPSTPEYL